MCTTLHQEKFIVVLRTTPDPSEIQNYKSIPKSSGENEVVCVDDDIFILHKNALRKVENPMQVVGYST